MNSLRETETAVALEVPEAVGDAVKAWSLGIAGVDQQLLAYNFIVYELCGINKLAFAAPGMGDWYNGRRYCGLIIANIVATPLEPPPLARPPARTMTERARRRARGET